MTSARDQSEDFDGILPELPGYRIERQLGRGSMGVVYLAEDLQLRRRVALKVLAPTLVDDELFRKRFDRESQSAANLDHPNIVPVYAAGKAGGLLYIAMRYVGGGDLRALIETNGPLSLEQTASLVAAVADALDAAHTQGMIHRDVKPANILIDGRGGQEHYYLSDFGITKTVSAGRSLTSTGQIVGTIDYIAPEQIQGKPVDGRADLYALGCVLYHCLTGTVPFPRDETAALMWAHVHDEPSPVTTRRPDLPPQIDHIVAKAMAKQPENRYDTCRELAVALRVLTADPSTAGGRADSGTALPPRSVSSPPSPPQPVPAGMTSTYTPLAPTPVRTSPTAKSSRWKWWWWIAASVLVVVVSGGSAVGVMKYLSSKFPNEAERALLGQVPLALTMKESCSRNGEAGRDPANVEASVTCTSDAGEVNKVTFTKFRSPTALDSHYQSSVATAGIGQSSGNCLDAEQAVGSFASESARTSGRTLCYQQLSSSFIVWTDDEAQTLAMATRYDPEFMKLRDWWTGVVGLPNSTQRAAEAKTKKDAEEAERKAKEQREAEAKKRAAEEAENKRRQEEKAEADRQKTEERKAAERREEQRIANEQKEREERREAERKADERAERAERRTEQRENREERRRTEEQRENSQNNRNNNRNDSRNDSRSDSRDDRRSGRDNSNQRNDDRRTDTGEQDIRIDLDLDGLEDLIPKIEIR